MLTIYKKDIHNYFSTFAGYLFIACILLVGGIYSYIYNFYYGYSKFENAVNYIPFFFIFLIPIISAGVFTEEKRQNTERLLRTLPFTAKQIVMGKYLAMLTIIAIPLLVLGCIPIIMSFYGEINFLSAYSNLFAVFLLGGCLCSICMFISSVTENIIISAVIGFALLFLIYQMDTFSSVLSASGKTSYVGFVVIAIALAIFIWYLTKNIYIAVIPAAIVIIVLNLVYKMALELIAGKINIVMGNLAMFSKLDGFLLGIFDVSSVIYYLSIGAFFVLITVFSYDRKRWI